MGLQRGIYTRVFLDNAGEPPWDCFGCAGPVFPENLNIHHVDEDHWNHNPENLAAMHRPCHTSLHNDGRRKPGVRSDNKVGLKEIQKDTRRNCFGARYTCLLCKKRLYVRGRWKTSGAAAEGRAKFEEEHMRDEHEIYAEGRQ